MIETRLLQYFLAIAHEENITRAAESLHITQSTLSKQMQDLEKQIGKILFIRGKRKITLTEEGRYLQQRGQEIIALVETTESALKENQELLNGNIYFGCGETIQMNTIISVFKGLQRIHPQIQFNMYTGDHIVIMDRLEQGLLDIGLVFEPQFKEGYDYMPLPDEDEFVLVLPKDDDLTKYSAIPREELKTLPLILSRQGFVNSVDYELFGTSRSALNITATYNLINNATYLVSQGIGYMLAISGLIDMVGHPDLTTRPLERSMSGTWYVVTKQHQVFSPTAARFLAELSTRIKG